MQILVIYVRIKVIFMVALSATPINYVWNNSLIKISMESSSLKKTHWKFVSYVRIMFFCLLMAHVWGFFGYALCYSRDKPYNLTSSSEKILQTLTLREKCPYSELFWSAFSRIRTRTTSNTDTFYAVSGVWWNMWWNLKSQRYWSYVSLFFFVGLRGAWTRKIQYQWFQRFYSPDFDEIATIL